MAQDRLGSVRLWGIQTTNLFPYGVEYTTTGQDHEKFATYIRDSFTGLDYASNRFYSSTLGRFTSADPSNNNVDLTNPLTWNQYAYVNGDPVNFNDPSGLDCFYDDQGGGGGDCTPGGGGDDGVPPDPEPPPDPCAGSSMAAGCPTDPPVAPDPDPCSGSSLLAAGCSSAPAPTPTPTPVPPAAWLRLCMLTVYSRGLAYPVIASGPGLHGYLDFTNQIGASTIVEGLHNGTYLGAASGPGEPSIGSTDDGSVSGTGVCAALSILNADVAQIENAHIIYSGVSGPNSSSALRYMLKTLSTLLSGYGSWYSIPALMQLFGYYTLLPGIETPGSSLTRLPRTPIPGIPRPPRVSR